MRALVQRIGYTTYRFEIGKDQLQVLEKSALKTSSYAIPYVSLWWQPTVSAESGTGWFVAGVVCTGMIAFSLLATRDWTIILPNLFYLLVAGFCFRRYRLVRITRHAFPVESPERAYVNIWSSIPEPRAVERFIGELHQAWQTFWSEKMRDEPPPGVTDELVRLAWLKDRGILSEEEMETLKRGLIEDFSKPKGGLGFRLDPED